MVCCVDCGRWVGDRVIFDPTHQLISSTEKQCVGLRIPVYPQSVELFQTLGEDLIYSQYV